MSTTQYAQHFDEVLESAQNTSPEVTQIRQEWENKSPDECVLAAREVLYEGMTPILRDNLDPTQLATAHALFETVFDKTIQSTSRRSGMRSSS